MADGSGINDGGPRGDTGTRRLFCATTPGASEGATILDLGPEAPAPILQTGFRLGCSLDAHHWFVPERLFTDRDNVFDPTGVEFFKGADQIYKRNKRINVLRSFSNCGLNGSGSGLRGPSPVDSSASGITARAHSNGALSVDFWGKPNVDPRLYDQDSHTSSTGLGQNFTHPLPGWWGSGDNKFGFYVAGSATNMLIYAVVGWVANPFGVSVSATIPLGWHHYAMTVDRDGTDLVELFIDGISQGTADITAAGGTLITTMVATLGAAGGPNAGTEETLSQEVAFSTGPVSLHSGGAVDGLLTAAQINAAVQNRTSALIPGNDTQGNPITKFRYDWRDFRLINDGVLIEGETAANSENGWRARFFIPCPMNNFFLHATTGVRTYDISGTNNDKPAGTFTGLGPVGLIPHSGEVTATWRPDIYITEDIFSAGTVFWFFDVDPFWVK